MWVPKIIHRRTLSLRSVQSRFNSSLRLRSFALSVAHPQKEEGEDAYFIANTKTSAGVADGVGGWSEFGIDSGAFARELMNGCKNAAEEKNMKTASDILGYGFDSVTSPGSSTACVISITENNILQVANLGDSGFFLLRKEESRFDSGDRRSPPPIEWAVAAATTEQLHSFNCPVQLGTSSNDTVECADISAIELEVGDVTVCCTDGVLDNVWEDELAALCAESFKESDACEGDMEMMAESAETFCQNILNLAVTHSEDTERRSPFEANAKRWGFRYRGGKMDDITVVVSLVERADEG